MTSSDVEEYEIEYIVKARMERPKKDKNGKWLYFVKWVGYPSNENTWEPEPNFRCETSIPTFWARVNTAGRDRTDTKLFKHREVVLPTGPPRHRGKPRAGVKAAPEVVERPPSVEIPASGSEPSRTQSQESKPPIAKPTAQDAVPAPVARAPELRTQEKDVPSTSIAPRNIQPPKTSQQRLRLSTSQEELHRQTIGTHGAAISAPKATVVERSSSAEWAADSIFDSSQSETPSPPARRISKPAVAKPASVSATRQSEPVVRVAAPVRVTRESEPQKQVASVVLPAVKAPVPRPSTQTPRNSQNTTGPSKSRPEAPQNTATVASTATISPVVRQSTQPLRDIPATAGPSKLQRTESQKQVTGEAFTPAQASVIPQSTQTPRNSQATAVPYNARTEPLKQTVTSAATQATTVPHKKQPSEVRNQETPKPQLPVTTAPTLHRVEGSQPPAPIWSQPITEKFRVELDQDAQPAPVPPSDATLTASTSMEIDPVQSFTPSVVVTKDPSLVTSVLAGKRKSLDNSELDGIPFFSNSSQADWPAKRRKATPAPIPEVNLKLGAAEQLDQTGTLKLHRAAMDHIQHGRLGFMDLVEVDSKQIKGNFLDLMDSQGGQLARTASALFDQDGQFRRLLTQYHPPKDRLEALYAQLQKENHFHRGRDNWRGGYRQDSRLLLLNCLNFDANDSDPSEDRIVQALEGLCASDLVRPARRRKSNPAEGNCFIICEPVEDDAINACEKFGFRRIGRTTHFAYTLDYRDTVFHDMMIIIREPHLESPKFPIHFAISWSESTKHLANIIRDAHAQNLESINKLDEIGYSPLLLAATLSKLYAVSLLLDLGVSKAVLQNLQNHDRLTPLRVNQQNLTVTKQNVMFFGASKAKAILSDEEEIQHLLKQAMGPESGNTCTCGSCDEGWLSARMRSRLDVTSNSILERTLKDKELFLAYFSPAVRLTVQQPAPYNGFRGIVKVIGDVFGGRDSDLTIPHVGKLIIPSTVRKGRSHVRIESNERKFELAGGRVINVLDCLIDVASKESAALGKPVCPNDLDFDLVRRKMGIWGELV